MDDKLDRIIELLELLLVAQSELPSITATEKLRRALSYCAEERNKL